MEFDIPERHSAMNYTIPIRTTKYLEVTYTSAVSGSNTTPPLDLIECMTYIADISSMYEEYSKKWFSRQVMSIVFSKNVIHSWDHGEQAPYISQPRFESVPIRVYQKWSPESLTITGTQYQINWKLAVNKYTEFRLENIASGELNGSLGLQPTPNERSAEVPYGQNQILMVLKRTSRSEYHRKVRKARLVAAAAAARFQDLASKYTERYGELGDASDSESE
jgi:hypothetical protein